MKKRRTLKDCLLKGEVLGNTFENKQKTYNYENYTVKDVVNRRHYSYLVLENKQIRNLADSLSDLEAIDKNQ